jgi:uncharacterized protein YuzE
MRVRYFEDNDTLLIALREGSVDHARDIDENTLVDVDANGDVVSIKREHAASRAELSQFMFERVAA